MSNKSVSPGDLRSLWQTMPVETVTVSMEEMRAKAEAFQKRIRRRNFIEYAATVFVVTVLIWYATWPSRAGLLWPVSNSLIIVGMLIVALNLHLRARAAIPPVEASAQSLIDFQRAELTRQRDALRTVWLWYILPVVPGIILWFIAIGIDMTARHPERAVMALSGTSIAVVLVFVIIILLNLLGAARLQRMIEDLDRHKEKP
ncbi:MAG: hypothetical protein QM773_08850 [Hyphomonadaceae bacterium]